MQLDLKDSVTRLTCFALHLLEEIQASPDDVDPDECRTTCIELFRAFDQPGNKSETFRSAKYALSAWIDDCLCRARWPHAAMWKARSLEQELFGTSCRNWKFFEQAELAAQREDWAALRVFQFCVAFGFRGIYARDRIKVRLSDRLPMSRAPLDSPTPILLDVLKEESSGVSRSQMEFEGEFSNDSSSRITTLTEPGVNDPNNRWERLLPPTLEEWSQWTFGGLEAGTPKGIRRWLGFSPAFPDREQLKEWTIVMAIGLLLTAVLFAIGH